MHHVLKVEGKNDMYHPENRRIRIEKLLNAYSDGRISAEEEQELFDLIHVVEDENLIRKHIEKVISAAHGSEQSPASINWETLYQKIEKRKRETVHDSKVRRMLPVKWVAAAVVAVLLGMGYYFLKVQIPDDHNNIVRTESSKAVDIAPPASTNAILTLANGQVVILDEAGNGTIVQQGDVDVVKLANGEIAYKGSGKEAGTNTLNNPRGSKVIHLTLADGTKVWLNAASTIKYPVAFTGKERKVELNGEAYFEVAHDASKPFVVIKESTEVKVLGTHFNVEAYDDEHTLDVTLLEGSVSVATAENKEHPRVIRPGQQAQIKKNGTVALANSVNLNEVMAWKENMFFFNGVTIETIMRQVARWYDVEVVFKNPVKEKFYAEVSKNTNISTLLEMLEATKAVHFEMEGDRVTVTP